MLGTGAVCTFGECAASGEQRMRNVTCRMRSPGWLLNRSGSTAKASQSASPSAPLRLDDRSRTPTLQHSSSWSAMCQLVSVTRAARRGDMKMLDASQATSYTSPSCFAKDADVARVGISMNQGSSTRVMLRSSINQHAW